jgi:hypothetical protein
VSAAERTYCRIASLLAARTVGMPPPGTITMVGLGSWSKVALGVSLTGVSLSMGSICSPTTTVRVGGTGSPS